MTRIILLVLLLLAGAAIGAAEPPAHWHLVVKFFNEFTGEQVDERELHGTNEPESGYATPLECVSDAIQIMGGMPPHDGLRASMFCQLRKSPEKAPEAPKVET